VTVMFSELRFVSVYMNIQGCIKLEHQVATFTKFCTLAPNNGETCVWGLLHHSAI